jgi:hypothetical protein
LYAVAAKKRRKRSLWLHTTTDGTTFVAMLVMASFSQKIKSQLARSTVEGELSVANFIDKFFKELRGKPVAGVACTERYHHTNL